MLCQCQIDLSYWRQRLLTHVCLSQNTHLLARGLYIFAVFSLLLPYAALSNTIYIQLQWFQLLFIHYVIRQHIEIDMHVNTHIHHYLSNRRQSVRAGQSQSPRTHCCRTAVPQGSVLGANGPGRAGPELNGPGRKTGPCRPLVDTHIQRLIRSVSFTFLLSEISREIYGKVKDDFLANTSSKFRCHGTLSMVMFKSKHEARLLLLFLR